MIIKRYDGTEPDHMICTVNDQNQILNSTLNASVAKSHLNRIHGINVEMLSSIVSPKQPKIPQFIEPSKKELRVLHKDASNFCRGLLQISIYCRERCVSNLRQFFKEWIYSSVQKKSYSKPLLLLLWYVLSFWRSFPQGIANSSYDLMDGQIDSTALSGWWNLTRLTKRLNIEIRCCCIFSIRLRTKELVVAWRFVFKSSSLRSTVIQEKLFANLGIPVSDNEADTIREGSTFRNIIENNFCEASMECSISTWYHFRCTKSSVQ